MTILGALIWSYIQVTAALLALALSLGVIIAYARLLPRERGMVQYFAASQVLIFGAYATRATFWSVRSLLRVAAEDPAYASAFWSNAINVPLNILVIVACYAALQAVYRMIPASERGGWSWMSAPLYPPWFFTSHIRDMIGPKVVERRTSRRQDNGARRRSTDRKETPGE